MRFGVHMHLGKAAFKFKFFATIHAATIRHDEKDLAVGPPCVSMSRGARSCHTKNKSQWETTPADGAYRSIASFGDEVLEMVVTLYKDSKTNTFEKKEYKFAIEDTRASSKGSVLAFHSTDLASYASLSMSTRRERLPARPVRKTVTSADMEVTIACEFLKQGNATDDDMMSTFSRASQANDSDDEEEREKNDVIAEVDEEYGIGDTPATLRSQAMFPGASPVAPGSRSDSPSYFDRATQTGELSRGAPGVFAPVKGDTVQGTGAPPMSARSAAIAASLGPPSQQPIASSISFSRVGDKPSSAGGSGNSSPSRPVSAPPVPEASGAAPGQVAAIAKRLSLTGPGLMTAPPPAMATAGTVSFPSVTPTTTSSSATASPTGTHHVRWAPDVVGSESARGGQSASSSAASVGSAADSSASTGSGRAPPPPPPVPYTEHAVTRRASGSSLNVGSAVASSAAPSSAVSATAAPAPAPAAPSTASTAVVHEEKKSTSFFSNLKFFRRNSNENLPAAAATSASNSATTSPGMSPAKQPAQPREDTSAKKHKKSKSDLDAENDRKDARIEELEEEVRDLRQTVARLHATISGLTAELERSRGEEHNLEMERREAVARMDLKGWLYKRGDRPPIKLWKRRWFATDLGNRLYYYGTHRGSEPYGFIDIDKITGIVVVPDAEQDKNHATFIVSVPGREYYLQAHDAEAMRKWIDSLDFVRKMRAETQRHTEIVRRRSGDDGIARISDL